MKRLLLLLLCTIATLYACARHYDISARRISTSDGLPSNTVIRVWQDAEGYMWFDTRNGICRFDGYQFRRFGQGTVTPPAPPSQLTTSDAQWVRTENGCLARHGNDGSVRSWRLIPADIIEHTRNDHFHVADVDERTEAISTYGNGLFLYDKPTGELTHYVRNDGSGVLSDNYLTGLFVDRTRCIWVIEDYLGVKCLRVNDLQYSPMWIDSTADVQDVNYIRCIAPLADGRLLVSNQMSDVYILNVHTGRITFSGNDGYRVYASLMDSKGRQWTGTRGNGLWCDGRKIGGLPSDDVFNVREDSEGCILVSMLGGGVARINDSGATAVLLAGLKAHDALADRQGHLWVAAEEGLYLTGSGGEMLDSLGGCFLCLHVDRSGRMWAGTYDRGLFRVEVNGRHIESISYSRTNGMASDCIQSVTEDRFGALWMGTEEGISRLMTESGAIENYKVAQGTSSDVFCERAAVTLDDGRLLFGSHNGLVVVTPTANNAPTPAMTVITGLSVNGNMAETDEPLTYRQNNLVFHFSNFQYANLQNVVYQYWLEGVDDDWSRPSSDFTATYRHLRPGRYTFRVRSDNGFGTWGEAAVMSIVIRQPWWNTWWAWLVYVLTTLIVATVAFVTVRRIVRLHQQLNVERKVAAFKRDFYNRIEREMRNPANVMQGAAENVQISGTTKTTVQSLRRGSRRMLKLMDMIQQFHRMDEVEMQAKAEQDAMNEESEQQFRNIQRAIHAEEQAFREMAPPPANAQSILVVEDDDDNLTHIADTLNPYFHIASCTSLQESEAAVRQHSPSLILMDITSDEKVARTLTRELTHAHPDVPVIHLSSFNDDSHQLLSLRAGAIDYIVKPVSGKVLLQRIKNGLATAQTHRTAPAAQPAQASELSAQPTKTSVPAADTPLLISVADKKFIDLFYTLLHLHVADDNLSVERMAELMGLGRTQFYKKVKALTGETPVIHLHRARLNYAAELLTSSRMKIEEVMVKAGFQSATHFYSSFKKQFGLAPRAYRLMQGGTA